MERRLVLICLAVLAACVFCLAEDEPKVAFSKQPVAENYARMTHEGTVISCYYLAEKGKMLFAVFHRGVEHTKWGFFDRRKGLIVRDPAYGVLIIEKPNGQFIEPTVDSVTCVKMDVDETLFLEYIGVVRDNFGLEDFRKFVLTKKTTTERE